MSEASQRLRVQAEKILADGMQLARYDAVMHQSMEQVRRFMIPMPDGISPYLERIVLDEGSETLPRVYLHLIYESDGDRDPHDHPFDFRSQIVFGSYEEQAYERYCTACDEVFYKDVKECGFCKRQLSYTEIERPRMFKAGDMNIKDAHQLHRLKVLKGPVVTLVTRGPKIREWGFQSSSGWVHHKTYIAEKFPDAQPTEVD